MELKEIEPKDLIVRKQSVTINGKEYFLDEKLSIDRFIAFQKLEVELAFRGGFAGMINTLDDTYEVLNKMRIADGIVLIDNARRGLRKQDAERRLPSLDICSLFLNTKEEDKRYITNEMLAEKQKDFESEGISIDFFLNLAIRLVRGFRERLETGESTFSEKGDGQKNKKSNELTS